MSPDTLFGTTVAAALTLMVFSYLLRANPLSRLAEHLLVAVATAYVLAVAIHWVLLPRLLLPLGSGERPDLLIPLVLGLLLLTKAVPSGAQLGNPSLAYLVGVGLALAVGGALVGTLFPQSAATMLPVLPGGETTLSGAIANGVVVVGTLLVLLSFLFVQRPTAPEGESGARPERPAPWRVLGRWFMMITFGAIFGGLAMTYSALLVGRLDFLINQWLRPLLGF